MSDKEHVSIDEMMDHLKRRGNREGHSATSEEHQEKLRNGKVVVRSDGSKAIKVRSRRRRTNQQKKEPEKSQAKRNIIVVGALIVLLLVGGVAYTMLLAYYNGNAFHDKVVDSIEKESGAEVELGSMEVGLVHAKASNAILTWDDFIIKKIKLEHLNAGYGISAFVGGGWSGKEITAAKATVNLDMVKDVETINRSKGALDANFQKIRSSKSAVRFGKSTKWWINDTALSLELKGDSYQRLHLDGGEFKSALREDLKISSGSIDFNENSCDVILRLGQEKSAGSILLEGEVGYVEGSEVKMEMKLDSVTLAPFLNSGLRRLFDGKVSAEIANLSMKVGDDSVEQFTINVNEGELEMKEFAFLNELKHVMENAYFTDTFYFSQSQAVIQKKDGKVSFTDLKLEEDKMSVTGNVTVSEDGTVSGLLKVGIAYEVLSDSSNAEKLETIFTERVGGYAWADANIRGVLGRPKDDLADKLRGLRGSDPVAPAPIIPREKTPQERIDELNQ